MTLENGNGTVDSALNGDEPAASQDVPTTEPNGSEDVGTGSVHETPPEVESIAEPEARVAEALVVEAPAPETPVAHEADSGPVADAASEVSTQPPSEVSPEVSPEPLPTEDVAAVSAVEARAQAAEAAPEPVAAEAAPEPDSADSFIAAEMKRILGKAAASPDGADGAEPEAAEEAERVEGEEPPEPPREYLPGDWFVVHTYAGYENKVKTNLSSRISSMNMEEKIFEVVIPMEDVMEIKSGKKQVVQRKVFPGYLLVRMDLDDDSWYVVRNTPGVTGFVGSGAKPIPLSEREVDRILQRKPAERPKPRLEWALNDPVRVTTGPFANFQGLISEIDSDRSKLKVLVNIFGRETPVELGFDQVAKV